MTLDYVSTSGYFSWMEEKEKIRVISAAFNDSFFFVDTTDERTNERIDVS